MNYERSGPQIMVQRNFAYNRDIGLYIYEKIDGKIWHGTITVKELDDRDRVVQTDPTISITDHEAQKLMDQLWHCGLRPSEGTGSAGSLAATQAHLKDLRTLLFHKEKINEK